MPKTKISEFSATPGNNTDIDGINIAEGCAPSGINDAIRELMAQLKDFQAGTAGDSFNGPVGTTTAAAGAFTTLSASSTVSGAGFSTYLASPPAIGGTAAAAGSFTTLSASSTLSVTSSTISHTVFSSTATNGGRAEFKDGSNLVGTIGNGSNTISSASSLEFCVNGNTITRFGIGGTEKMRLSSSDFRISSGVTFTLDGGTANGVAYLNGSKVVTTGSALVYDGTILRVNGSTTSGLRLASSSGAANGFNLYNDSSTDIAYLMNYYNGSMVFGVNNSEQARLTSTGLGIGTSSPGYKVTAVVTSGSDAFFADGNTQSYSGYRIRAGAGGQQWAFRGGATTMALSDVTASLDRLVIDSSGNVGIGTSSPSDILTLAGGASGSYGLTINNAKVGGGTKAIFQYDATNQIALLGGNTTNGLALQTLTSGSLTTKATLDSSGNLGLGVTPSASTIAQFEGGSNLLMVGRGNAYLSNNATFNSSFKYINTAAAGQYNISGAVHSWYTAPSGTAGNAIPFTQAMTLDASGNLLVGVTSSSSRLHVDGGDANISRTSANSRLLVTATGVANTALGFNNSGSAATGMPNNAGYVNVLQAYPLVFGTDSTERARITSGGYFKASDAGTYFNSTASYHELRQTADNICAFISSTNATQTQNVVQIDVTRDTTNNTFYALSYYNRTAAAFRFRVADSGNVTNTNNSYGAISDAKMKTDIVDAGSQWADIKGLRFRKFKMKDDPQQVVQLGVVAQEVEQVSPGLVEEHADKDAEGNDLGTTTKSVKTSVLLMKAAVALQEAMARIEQLEAKVASLEAK